MPSISEEFNHYIECFENNIRALFNDKMLLVDKQVYIEHMGGFKLTYTYLPSAYTIEIESELGFFGCSIQDESGASNSLSRICKHERRLSAENILNSLNLLKKILEENDFPLYIYNIKKNKFYKKYRGKVTALEDTSELHLAH